MFRKSRHKIISAIMAALLLFLAITVTTVYVFGYVSMKNQNTEMLDKYVEAYSLDTFLGNAARTDTPPSDTPREGTPPGDAPEKPKVNPPGVSPVSLYQLSSFYSAAVADDGTILATDTGKNGMYEEADIVTIAREILQKKTMSGEYGTLLYKVSARDKYTLVAFLDTTLTENSFYRLMITTMAAGLISIFVFFLISVFLAKKIIQPLEENDRRQKQFVSDAGHELKTPVAVIEANAELLARQLGENQWLANIRHENDRMGNLVKELLALSHAETDTRILEEIDFSRLTEQEVLPFESVAFEKGLTLAGNINPDIRVRGNRSQLAQLVSILVDNAISHSSGGPIINVELKKVHKNAALTVTNPGDEIPEDMREHLFERFFRLDEARTANEEHFGLGLPIAKAITDAHKGSIHIDCRDGKVIFEALLPAE